jgi:hypothetical protein
MGRLARGFVLNINDERLRETIRIGRQRGETLRDAFEAAWRGAAEENKSTDHREYFRNLIEETNRRSGLGAS